jgi:hypothetical protein
MNVNMGMQSIDFTGAARRLGMLSAVGVVVLGAAYLWFAKISQRKTRP